MQVILLDKVANLGSLVIRLTLKRAMLVTSWYQRVKLFRLPRKTLNTSKHVALNWKLNWLTFWLLQMHAQRKSTPWKPLLSRLKQATKVNCSVPSVLATSLTL
ncbi:Uncharacterised protein [Salmonella enterica subsp. enterica]|uniref:Uncharacterized protein n=1 Tax=Salmonella enterica I TaxID=59201 RepID=A0A379WG03_SALET|nr:Uncharacterised protein [Salmonella enterica subsp. enterica]